MLTSDQVAQFQRDGFAVSPGFLTSERVRRILAEVETICDGNTLADHDASRMEMEPDQSPDDTAVRRLYEPCTYYDTFRELSEDEALLDALEQLIGSDILFHYSKLNMKPADIGSVVEWHQDLSYYPLTNADSLAVLFYLDDTDEENGHLRMIPGRHREPLMEHSGERYFQGRVTEAVDDETAVGISAAAGAAIFMHGMTPHASAINQSSRPRRTLILSYRAADAFPIYCGEMTAKAEEHVRLVRGERLTAARLEQQVSPIPQYAEKAASLYELQKKSRSGEIN